MRIRNVINIRKSVREILLLLALGYMSAGCEPAFAASSNGTAKLACNWTLSGYPLRTPPDTSPFRYSIIDTNAGYWQAALSSFFPAGTEFRIRGQYPASRNMSIQVTNALFGGLQTIAAISDWQIKPDAGSRSPYPAANLVDRSVPAGGAFSVVVHYGKAPATPAANTIYLDPADFVASGAAIIVYRIYAAFAPLTVADTGGVPLPSISLMTAAGDIPLSGFETAPLCATLEVGQAVVMQSFAASGAAKYSKPLAPAPIPAQPVPPAPRFMLWGGDDVLGQSSGAQVVVNADNNYVYTALSQVLGDLVLVRARMPSYATQAGVNNPQLRYWSLCNSSIEYLSTFGCINDENAVLDAEGYFNVVISVPSKRPANATAAHGFQWLNFGKTEPTYPMFRYMSPAPGFAQAPQNYFNGGYTALQQVMGDYYPQSTYCAKAVFDKYSNAGLTPAQVFAACAAGQ